MARWPVAPWQEGDLPRQGHRHGPREPRRMGLRPSAFILHFQVFQIRFTSSYLDNIHLSHLYSASRRAQVLVARIHMGHEIAASL